MEKDFYDASKGLNLNQANFRFAIGATNYDYEARNDPKYIKWFVRNKYKGADDQRETVLPVHKCT